MSLILKPYQNSILSSDIRTYMLHCEDKDLYLCLAVSLRSAICTPYPLHPTTTIYNLPLEN